MNKYKVLYDTKKGYRNSVVFQIDGAGLEVIYPMIDEKTEEIAGYHWQTVVSDEYDFDTVTVRDAWNIREEEFDCCGLFFERIEYIFKEFKVPFNRQEIEDFHNHVINFHKESRKRIQLCNQQAKTAYEEIVAMENGILVDDGDILKHIKPRSRERMDERLKKEEGSYEQHN